ncbi:hypothetical protein [Variovorax sp. PBL-H6]|uniref:hypothetical protein n=1 Tax=Variovorax sp. PBL-H6 TaxID=434009 RepID=UPI0013A56AC2|nr:hypothetical protein [Variovorax sp. PBL-H6]
MGARREGRLSGELSDAGEWRVLAAFCPSLAPANLRRQGRSGFRLFGYFQSVFNFNPEIAHGAGGYLA